MSGTFLLIMLFAELGFMVYSLLKKNRVRLEYRVLWLIQAAAIGAYYLASPRGMGFQWFFLLVFMVALIVLGILGVIRFTRKKDDKPFKAGGVVGRAILKSFLWLFVMVPLLIFPPYKEPETTGNYTIANQVYTWTDESRVETLDDSGDKRNVTVTFYYPAEAKEGDKFPLILFSHGAFGFEKSNYSSYAELVSNGYVVCSLSHTYQAFFTEEADGTTKIVNSGFIQEAIDATNGVYSSSLEDEYALTRKWMEVRMGDANFVLDTIEKNCAEGTDEIFRMIDLEHIGAYGHSMGGATAEALGRQREEIDAVIVLDGTFLGDYTGVENGIYQFNTDAYPKPLLNVMAMDHYNNNYKPSEEDAHAYVNFYTVEHADLAKNVVIEGTGHMNLTDLPLFSPTLAGMLGTGERDGREVIEITNDVVREWFDAYVKEDGVRTPAIKNVY